MPYLTTDDGARLFYRVQGRDSGAAPLIFVHGWCSRHEHWAPQARHFGRHRRVLRLDRRGMGRSGTPGSGHTAEQHAADIAAVAAAADIRAAVLVGHAGGAPGTLACLRNYPRLARAGVIVDAGMYPEPRIGAADSAFGMVLGSMIEALSGPAPRRALRRMYRGYFGPKCDREVVRGAVDEALQTDLGVAIDELRGMAVDVEAIAQDIRVPVL